MIPDEIKETAKVHAVSEMVTFDARKEASPFLRFALYEPGAGVVAHMENAKSKSGSTARFDRGVVDMLPDFPKVKEKILATLNKRMQTRSMPLSCCNVKHYHEGHLHRIVRADGSVVENEFNEASGEITLDLSQEDTMEDIIAKVDTVAETMKSQMTKHFLDELTRAVEQVGNAIDFEGKPLTAERFLEALEKTEFGFYDDGTPHELTLFCSPKMAPRIEIELQRLQTDPEFVRRYDELIERKRDEWRERENSRKLVG